MRRPATERKIDATHPSLLCAARDYLERVQADVGPSGRRERAFRGVTGGADEEESGSGSDGESGGGAFHRVSEKLQHDAAEVNLDKTRSIGVAALDVARRLAQASACCPN